ncbi:MAG: hypothetical protein B6I22_14520 [Desulfobacteraceae bacterium 4572_123]|nr:MAG: hypothetical protein B6I22_14520 [Desulfobacteraceae bacterium 4572_123]
MGESVPASSEYFKALGDETRFKILSLLLSHDLCVGALAKRLKISEAAVSQHLQVLRKARFVRGEKRGYWTHYAVQTDMLVQIADDLKKMVAGRPGTPGVCSRTSPILEPRRGKEVMDMCQDCCQHPEKLKEKPEDCTSEQIRECHGDTKEHPCIPKKK